VRFHAKNAAVVKTDALENAVAIKKTVIENRNLRVRRIEEFSVDVNLERFRGGSFGSRRGGGRDCNVFGKHEKTSGGSAGNSSGETSDPL